MHITWYVIILTSLGLAFLVLLQRYRWLVGSKALFRREWFGADDDGNKSHIAAAWTAL